MGNACEERVLGEQGQGTWVIGTEARVVCGLWWRLWGTRETGRFDVSLGGKLTRLADGLGMRGHGDSQATRVSSCVVARPLCQSTGGLGSEQERRGSMWKVTNMRCWGHPVESQAGGCQPRDGDGRC